MSTTGFEGRNGRHFSNRAARRIFGLALVSSTRGFRLWIAYAVVEDARAGMARFDYRRGMETIYSGRIAPALPPFHRMSAACRLQRAVRAPGTARLVGIVLERAGSANFSSMEMLLWGSRTRPSPVPFRLLPEDISRPAASQAGLAALRRVTGRDRDGRD